MALSIPQGIMPALPPYWYQLVARPLGFLPFPSLKETLRLFKDRKKFCPKLEKVLPQNMTPFSKIQFCIYYIFNKFSFLHDKDRRRKSSRAKKFCSKLDIVFKNPDICIIYLIKFSFSLKICFVDYCSTVFKIHNEVHAFLYR